jgi:hypothetical protein
MDEFLETGYVAVLSRTNKANRHSGPLRETLINLTLCNCVKVNQRFPLADILDRL